MDDWELRRHDGTEALAMLDRLADVYQQVYSEPPYDSSGTMNERQTFLDRTTAQAQRDGFQLVTAHPHSALEEIAGYSFGLPFPAWWRGASTEEPAELDGVSRFAVIELIVHASWRGHGLGRALMDELLASRPEEYATLLSRPDTAARQMYRRWGWRKIDEVQPYADAPTMDALLLPLAR